MIIIILNINYNPHATHTRLIRPSMPIPLKSVLGSSPWKPMSPHCLVILDSSLTVGINNSHNWIQKSGDGYKLLPLQVIIKSLNSFGGGGLTLKSMASWSWSSELKTFFLRSSTDTHRLLYPVICSRQTRRLPLNLEMQRINKWNPSLKTLNQQNWGKKRTVAHKSDRRGSSLTEDLSGVWYSSLWWFLPHAALICPDWIPKLLWGPGGRREEIASGYKESTNHILNDIKAT